MSEDDFLVKITDEVKKNSFLSDEQRKPQNLLDVIKKTNLLLRVKCVSADAEEMSILKEAKELGKSMDLNIVRLRFTAYLQDSNGGFTRALKPVVSNPIYDSSESNKYKESESVVRQNHSGKKTI